jgi:hypothetical protein
MRLEEITFKSPCTVPWEGMTGNDRVRFCGSCRRHVYSIAAMTRDEAQAFLDREMGKTCIQLWKREDGTIITKDCGPTPPGPRPPARLGGAPMRTP